MALHVGLVLRAMARDATTAEVLFDNEIIQSLLELAGHADFEVSSEAFAVLRELVSSQVALVAQYFENHGDLFLTMCQGLLQSDAYVTNRQALGFLGIMLFDHKFMGITLRFVSNDNLLKAVMNLLKDESNSIRIDAFHVFKLFVGNPEMSRSVRTILYRNRDRLSRFFQAFHAANSSNSDLLVDISDVIDCLGALQSPRARYGQAT